MLFFLNSAHHMLAGWQEFCYGRKRNEYCISTKPIGRAPGEVEEIHARSSRLISAKLFKFSYCPKKLWRVVELQLWFRMYLMGYLGVWGRWFHGNFIKRSRWYFIKRRIHIPTQTKVCNGELSRLLPFSSLAKVSFRSGKSQPHRLSTSS